MTVHADAFWSQLDFGRRVDPIKMRETHWGVVVSDRRRRQNDGAAAEMSLKLMAIGILFGAAMPWTIQAGLFAEAPFLIKVGVSAAAFLIGYAVYSYAGRGFRQEIQVDASQRELRLVTRNSRGISSVRRTIEMRDISSCYLNRSKSGGKGAKLFVRLKSSSHPLPVATGPERDLVPVIERITELVRSSHRY